MYCRNFYCRSFAKKIIKKEFCIKLYNFTKICRHDSFFVIYFLNKVKLFIDFYMEMCIIMDTDNLYKLNYRYCFFQIMRWFLFGIVIVIIPPIYNVWYKMIIGYKLSFAEFVPDVILAVLSVSCNFINICIDSDKRIYYWLRWILCIVLGIISIGCYGLFFVIRFIIDKNENNYLILEKNSQKLFYVSSIIIVVCFIIGVLIELITYIKTKKERCK